jgi:UDP-GlcNAc:undecaprenyl-phosphate GlcNAc-1-phosphate transferase
MQQADVLAWILQRGSDPTWSYLVALFLPYLVALLLVPRTLRWAVGRGWLDRPSGRKRHEAPIPLLGGVAVFISAALGLLVGASVSEPIRIGLWGQGSLSALGLGLAGIVLLGVYDDLRDMRASSKLLAQIVIASATCGLGFQCGAVQLPFGLAVVESPIASFLVTVAWIVLVTNAFNLIDGIDGLAAGLGIAAALTIVVLAADYNASVAVLAALALSGSLSAFLRYNLPPARIFLGDAGAMGIGYTTAVLSIASYQKGPTAMVLVVPILALGVPVLDTFLAVVRRTVSHLREHGLSAIHPLEVVRAVMRSDRGHVHYLLLRSGWSVRAVLFTLYAVSAVFGALALWTRQASSTTRWGLWLVLLIGSWTCLWLLERRADRRERNRRGAEANPGIGPGPPLAPQDRLDAAASHSSRKG